MLSKDVKLRILVVDDHPGMREGIRAVVNSQPDMMIIGEASDGQEAIQQFKSLLPDVSLLDWNLPKARGDEVLETIIREFPNARFIVITALHDIDCIRRALRLGAQGCLHKDMLRRELLPALRAVHQGQQYVPDEISDRLRNGS